jgi:Uma2 family endonuclease
MQTTETPFTLRLWTVEEYHRMAEAGIFHPAERVELIGGQIIKMIAKGTAHTAAVRRTARVLRNLLENQAEVYTQDPIQLDDFSEPEPDIAVVRLDPLDYADHHPTPAEIDLIIEVSDTTFKYDRETKAKAYAKSGIADYWVLNVNERKLHVFRELTQDGYQNEVIFSEESSVLPLQFPTLVIVIQEILPPQITQ